MTPVFSKAICMTSCSLGECTISLRLRLEILVTSEVADEQCHELGVLLWVHQLLDVHEALGKPHGLVISQLEQAFQIHEFSKGVPRETLASHRRLSIHTIRGCIKNGILIHPLAFRRGDWIRTSDHTPPRRVL